MARSYITPFSMAYQNNAKPRRRDATLDKHCRACGEVFDPDDWLHICYSSSRPKRRHVKCAIQKKVTTEREVRKLWEQVAKDMNITFDQIMRG